MKILQIVTLLTEDNRFGGPATVARNQSRWLARAGHEVTLMGLGDTNVRSLEDGYQLQTFKLKRLITKLGYSGISSLSMFLKAMRIAKDVDAVHVHLSRDLVTAPLAFLIQLRNPRVVVQTHGMVGPDERIAARLFDAMLVRRILLRAHRVLALTSYEENSLVKVSKGKALSNLHRLGNGVDLPDEYFSGSGEGREALFVSRLEKRKQPLVFAQAASELRSVSFVMAGKDQGELPEVLRYANEENLTNFEYVGELTHVEALERIRDAGVLVLPAYGEVFPMVVLEALSFGTPVVLTEQCGLSDSVRDNNAGLVVDDKGEAIANAVRELLGSRTARTNARAAAVSLYSSEAVQEHLVSIYEMTQRR